MIGFGPIRVHRRDPRRLFRFPEEKYAAGSLRLVDQFGGQALAASIRHLLISPKGAGLLFCDSTGMYWNRMPLMDFLKEPADTS